MRQRLTQLRYHAIQYAYWTSKHRFNVVLAGRRSGKTELAKRKLVKRTQAAATSWVPRFFAAAPTRDQAKRIFWDDLKSMFERKLINDISESDLMIETVLGQQLYVIGLDKPERMEGQPWDGGVVDEIGNTRPGAWPENIRPALSDRKGWCDLIGVPEGRNHYWDLSKKAIASLKEFGDKSEWGHYHWKSADILDADEIAAAKRDLDELTFQQEYEASFINFEGRAYYPFSEDEHTVPLKYDPKQPLILCFDFNVEPGVCAIIQEQLLPKQYERDVVGRLLLNKPITGTGVIDEVHIPRNSNTPAVCRKIIEKYGTIHKGAVRCYGDATGGSRGSAKVEGSDWALIEKELRPVFRDRLSIRVDPANPKERARINAVNSRLKTKDRTIRLLVDPSKAPNVSTDFEGVRLLKGGSGEIDKQATPKLTHISDAIGYYIVKVFPIVSGGAIKMEITGT